MLNISVFKSSRYVLEIPEDVQETWASLGSWLSKALGLPGLQSLRLGNPDTFLILFSDLDTTSGLRKVHREFEKISRTIDEFYTFARSFPGYEPRIAAGAVVIYSKLCADNVLLRRIILETGTIVWFFCVLGLTAQSF